MVTFEESRTRGKPRRNNSRGRDSGRKFSRDRPKRTEFTKVVCDSCGTKCEVPFKPTSNKPIYCEKCFSKPKEISSSVSERDMDIINEKLNKIMKALKIE